MFIDEKEDDDDMHMPLPDDDIRFKPRLRDHFTRENACSTVGLILMLVGLLFIFVVLPVLFNTGAVTFTYAYETPLDQMPGFGKPEQWAIVNDRKYPFLQNIRTKLIDKATPKSAYTRKSFDGPDLQLVFSDEFNDNNRTFYEGDDPYWFAGDFWYGATQDLDWYDPDAVTTWDGKLEIRLDAFKNHDLNFRSGMLNSWNQLCFKGGAFEVGISLPGPAGIMGLWPGAWTMGNLGRPGYLSTTDGLWPYTYNDCDAGITPNQSSPDGISHLPGQRLPSCACEGEDHPTPGTGRGAPEIDILEASASYQVKDLGVITQSFQVAPFDPWYYPDYEYMSFPTQNISYTNTYTGGPFQQAVSGTTTLNNDWYDGKEYQKYSFEYRPGTGKDGWITWYVGDDVMFTMDGRAIRQNGNVGDRVVSEEPMSMILNLGFSNSWVAIDWQDLKFPTIMRVDYVRLYQPEGETMITCDPPGYETTQYIADHMDAYTNPNWTKWDQTGYGWPKHKLNNPGCEVGSSSP
ncbi:beta-glucan synthesis-associated [Rhizodiscina lignyota]|uniref:Beta-glucan synthesis-associated n=1 Tax=Rhizodiscina lignyota TaxID=1504668 RepID=A0A9P4IKM8_9PEZI|nr:beta-glucan synthesis-associated [Rhizodiscina lignyota]